MSSPTPYEERQTELNPHRGEDRDRATEVAYSQLRQRGVNVDGSEPAADLATLVSAVERFEEVVSSLGADRMTNSLDTDDPDDTALVLPQRHADESVADYADRVQAAAARLAGEG
jgi:hypothetical protein